MQHRTSLVAEVMRREEKLRDRTVRYWMEIGRRNYGFNSRENLVSAINEVSLEDFQNFFKMSVLGGNTLRLVVRSFGKLDWPETAYSVSEIVDPLKFRLSLDQFP